MGIPTHLLEPYGEQVMKIKLDAIEALADRPTAKYVVVSAITRTPLGEGKPTTTVGLGQAFRHIGKHATVAIRQPSMGPTFGIKGGAAGGGYSQVVPMEVLNLRLTGDMHAVTAAHNMLSAMLDNHLYQGNKLAIDLHNITWKRVLDVNDRALRNIIVGLGAAADGVPRQTGFDITAASEVMAVLPLAPAPPRIRAQLGRVGGGVTPAGAPGEGETAHARGGLRPLPEALLAENPEEVQIGGANLRKHIDNVRAHGVTPVVAINSMPEDFASEHKAIAEIAASMGVRSAVCTHFADGGRGAAGLAEAVTEAADEPTDFHFLEPAEASLREKIETVASRIYGADGVDYAPLAARQLDGYERNGFGGLPVCIAKTPLSLSHDPSLKGAPAGWRLPAPELPPSVRPALLYPPPPALLPPPHP